MYIIIDNNIKRIQKQGWIVRGQKRIDFKKISYFDASF